jgi:hypothetical protein
VTQGAGHVHARLRPFAAHALPPLGDALFPKGHPAHGQTMWLGFSLKILAHGLIRAPGERVRPLGAEPLGQGRDGLRVVGEVGGFEHGG